VGMMMCLWMLRVRRFRGEEKINFKFSKQTIESN
jgi:hypothetical protein